MSSPVTCHAPDAPHRDSVHPTETIATPPAATGRSYNSITPGERGRYLWDLAVYDRQAIRACAIEHCCTDASIWTKDGHFTAFPRRCRDRLCPRCQAALQHRYTAEIVGRVQMWTHPKHIVLTLVSSDTPLRDQIKRLKRSFNRLRASAVWKQLAGKGVYTLELTRNAKDRRWHPHLHVLTNAKYIPHEWLSATWHRITGDSTVVWIERAEKKHATYVAKYVGKSYDGHLEPWEEWPLADELAGLRTCETFGGEERIRLHKPADEADGWQFLGTLSNYRRRAQEGEFLACLVMDELIETGALDRLKLEELHSSW